MPFEKASFRPKTAALPPVDGAAGHAPGYGAGVAAAPGGVRLLTMRGGLILGFGVLLILLILSGLSALHALSELQASNETTLQQFLAKNQQLDEIRTAVYLSGTYIRDYLLEPNRDKAEQSRNDLIDANSRIES